MNLFNRLWQWKRQGANRCVYRGVVEWWTVGPNGEKVRPQRFKNGLATVGINAALETVFRSGTQYTSWYAGLIDSTGYSGVAASDTMASHAGWTEFTSYSGANRPQWSPAAAAGGIIANTTNFSYTISADGSLKGLFITTVAAKSPGNTGTLWSTALVDRSVTNGSTLNGVYSFTLTPSS